MIDNNNVTSDYINVLPSEFVLDYERLAREIIKQQNIRKSNVTDTVKTAHSTSISSPDVSQSANLMEIQTQS